MALSKDIAVDLESNTTELTISEQTPSTVVEQQCTRRRVSLKRSLAIAVSTIGLMVVVAVCALQTSSGSVMQPTEDRELASSGTVVAAFEERELEEKDQGHVQPSEDRILGGSRVKIGAHVSGSLKSLEDQLGGAHFDISMMYSSIGSAGNQIASIKTDMSRGRDIIMNLDFSSHHDSIIGGQYDSAIDNFASKLKGSDVKYYLNKGRTIWLRPMHEFNGDWYPWGIYAGGGNSKDKFKTAYRHVVQRFKSKIGDGRVKYQLGYNCDNPGYAQYDSFGSSYPGGDVVDMITCNAYNRYGINSWFKTYESFYSIFHDGYNRMKAINSGKPLGIGETSTVSRGGSKSDWIRKIAGYLNSNFQSVVQINFFLQNSQGDWALNDSSQRSAMRDFIWSCP